MDTRALNKATKNVSAAVMDDRCYRGRGGKAGRKANRVAKIEARRAERRLFKVAGKIDEN
jgi:hypothetical protein